MPRAQVRSIVSGASRQRVGWYAWTVEAPEGEDARRRALPGEVIEISDAELARGIDLGMLDPVEGTPPSTGGGDGPAPESFTFVPALDPDPEAAFRASAEAEPADDSPRGGAEVARSVHAREDAGSIPAPAMHEGEAPEDPAEAPERPAQGTPAPGRGKGSSGRRGGRKPAGKG